METKKCKTCEQVKNVDEFHKHSTNKDGKRSNCKKCRSADFKKNKVKIREYRRQLKLRNPEKIKEQKRLDYLKNKERYIERATERYQNKKDEIKDYFSSYYKDNYCKIIQNVRVRDRNLSNSRLECVTNDDFIKIYTECKEMNSENQLYEVDHIIPIKNSKVCGLDVPWNLQILKKEENNFKRNKFDGTYENESWKVKFSQRFGG
jgi:hypothetical protein